MTFDAALRWARYEERKKALIEAIRKGTVKETEYEKRLKQIATECGV